MKKFASLLALVLLMASLPMGAHADDIEFLFGTFTADGDTGTSEKGFSVIPKFGILEFNAITIGNLDIDSRQTQNFFGARYAISNNGSKIIIGGLDFEVTFDKSSRSISIHINTDKVNQKLRFYNPKNVASFNSMFQKFRRVLEENHTMLKESPYTREYPGLTATDFAFDVFGIVGYDDDEPIAGSLHKETMKDWLESAFMSYAWKPDGSHGKYRIYNFRDARKPALNGYPITSVWISEMEEGGCRIDINGNFARTGGDEAARKIGDSLVTDGWEEDPDSWVFRMDCLVGYLDYWKDSNTGIWEYQYIIFVFPTAKEADAFTPGFG